MNIKQAWKLSLITTAVLWVTGIVTVPFTSTAAMEWIETAGISDRGWAIFLAHQFENAIYSFGRIPLLFSIFVAFSIWTGPKE